jgi:hypothetical protein
MTSEIVICSSNNLPISRNLIPLPFVFYLYQQNTETVTFRTSCRLIVTPSFIPEQNDRRRIIFSCTKSLRKFVASELHFHSFFSSILDRYEGEKSCTANCFCDFSCFFSLYIFSLIIRQSKLKFVPFLWIYTQNICWGATTTEDYYKFFVLQNSRNKILILWENSTNPFMISVEGEIWFSKKSNKYKITVSYKSEYHKAIQFSIDL